MKGADGDDQGGLTFNRSLGGLRRYDAADERKKSTGDAKAAKKRRVECKPPAKKTSLVSTSEAAVKRSGGTKPKLAKQLPLKRDGSGKLPSSSKPRAKATAEDSGEDSVSAGSFDFGSDDDDDDDDDDDENGSAPSDQSLQPGDIIFRDAEVNREFWGSGAVHVAPSETATVAGTEHRTAPLSFAVPDWD